MKNKALFDYLYWRGDLSLNNAEFNPIDGIIFSELSFLDLTFCAADGKVKLHKALVDYYKSHKAEKRNFGMLVPDKIYDLGIGVRDAKRYKNMEVSDNVISIDSNAVEQFVALCFHFDDKMVISFQGTDDSLVGWQEDLKMIIDFPVSSQIKAQSYINSVGRKYPNEKIYVVGHSKGGNLAMYSAMYASDEIKKRIIKVYNFDGPGFESDDLDEELYQTVKDKITTFVPDHSMVGMLFNQLGTLEVVKSSERRILQHDPFSWQIKGGDFVSAKLSSGSINYSKELSNYLINLDVEKRKSVCDAFGKFIESSKCESLKELNVKRVQAFFALKELRKERTILMDFLGILVRNHII